MSDNAASVVEVVGSALLVTGAALVATPLGFLAAGGLCWLFAWRSTS